MSFIEKLQPRCFGFKSENSCFFAFSYLLLSAKWFRLAQYVAFDWCLFNFYANTRFIFDRGTDCSINEKKYFYRELRFCDCHHFPPKHSVKPSFPADRNSPFLQNLPRVRVAQLQLIGGVGREWGKGKTADSALWMQRFNWLRAPVVHQKMDLEAVPEIREETNQLLNLQIATVLQTSKIKVLQVRLQLTGPDFRMQLIELHRRTCSAGDNDNGAQVLDRFYWIYSVQVCAYRPYLHFGNSICLHTGFHFFQGLRQNQKINQPHLFDRRKRGTGIKRGSSCYLWRFNFKADCFEDRKSEKAYLGYSEYWKQLTNVALPFYAYQPFGSSQLTLINSFDNYFF